MELLIVAAYERRDAEDRLQLLYSKGKQEMRFVKYIRMKQGHIISFKVSWFRYSRTSVISMYTSLLLKTSNLLTYLQYGGFCAQNNSISNVLTEVSSTIKR